MRCEADKMHFKLTQIKHISFEYTLRNENGRKPPDALQFHVIVYDGGGGDGGWWMVAVMLIFGFTETRKTSCKSCNIVWLQNDASYQGAYKFMRKFNAIPPSLSRSFILLLACTKQKLGMHNNT